MIFHHHRRSHLLFAALAVGVLSLSACGGGDSGISGMARNITPTMPDMFAEKKKEPAPQPVFVPPPSPTSPEDQVKLPAGARSMTSNFLKPLDDKITIGLLLPLSGNNTNLGKDLADAAQLALFDIQNPEIVLVPIDTKGTDAGAIEAMNKAVAAKADIIVGPVFKAEAEAALPVANQHDLKLITFSNDTSLAKDGAFVFGFMPEQQIERAVEYALKKGVHDFYVLAPDNEIAKATNNVLDRLKGRYEFTVHLNSTYDVISNKGMVEGASDIAKHAKEAKKNDRAMNPRALIVPEGGSRLNEIAKIIGGFGITSTDLRIVGSGQMDDPATPKQRRLLGSWFASSSPEQRSVFVKHFKNVYGYEPVRIASVTYDSVALVGFLAKMSGNRFSTSAIINERGFAGVDGVFRFNPEHISERSLAVMEVIPNGFEVVDEAPKVLPNFSKEIR